MSEPRGPGCAGVSLGLIIGLVVGGSVGWLCGVLIGESGRYHAEYLTELNAISPALTKDPSFKAVEIRERSDGGIFLEGTVPTLADRDRLSKILTNAIGEARTHLAMIGVNAEEKPLPHE
jgi:hypothetical protein